MRLRFGFLCEFAAEMANGTNMVVSIFDRMKVARTPDAPLLLMPHTLYVVVEDSSVSAPRHLMGFKLLNADGGVLLERELPFNIGNAADVAQGTKKAGNVCCRVGGDIVLPEGGDYEWDISVDGERLGSIPFTVVEQPLVAQPS